MMPDRYAWLVWSSAFLLPWLAVYAAFPRQRKVMLWASLFTMPFGLTEPLFVPTYWHPPSLFDFAQRTGFDIESLIFTFGIGGIGAVLYNLLTGNEPTSLPPTERLAPLHRFHSWALATPFVSFPLLFLFHWNPIYPAIVAMTLGALATMVCRPDLASKVGIGAILFLGYYTVFLFGLELTAPGYIGRVWNLPALSGLEIASVPVEELLFAVSFGAYWSSVYEHFTWSRPAIEEASRPGTLNGDDAKSNESFSATDVSPTTAERSGFDQCQGVQLNPVTRKLISIKASDACWPPRHWSTGI